MASPPSSCPSCPLSSSSSILVPLCCFPSLSPSLVSLSCLLLERRPLTVPFRCPPVVPVGAGSVRVGVFLVLAGIVYGYVLWVEVCRLDCVSFLACFCCYNVCGRWILLWVWSVGFVVSSCIRVYCVYCFSVRCLLFLTLVFSPVGVSVSVLPVSLSFPFICILCSSLSVGDLFCLPAPAL